MKKTIVSITFLLFIISSYAQVAVTNLQVENLQNPIGMRVIQPRFTWQLHSNTRNTTQSAYEIKVDMGNKLVWNSGKVASDSSVHVAYKGSPLQSNKKYTWQVRVWDNTGKVSAWSSPAFFQMGLLNIADWAAKWIEPGYEEDSILHPAPIFRKSFNIHKKIHAATLYATAHGMYELQLNGTRVGDAWLTPGWTSYKKRLQYQAHDVTAQLKQGANIMGAIVGNGWYRSVLGWGNNGDIYGKDFALLLQINIVYEDGSEEIFITDDSWKSSTGEILYSQIYNGEIIDARKTKEGWLNNDYNDVGWSRAKIANHPMNVLVATYNEPVKKHEVFKPLKIFTTPAGERVIDFGQNLVGWVQMKVKGNAGDSVTISHAEVLDKKGNFYTENLRAAKAQAKYILKGGGVEIFHPYFTWMGFRYIKIEGYPGEITAENFEAVSLYSNMEPTGTFSTSNKLINQLQQNIVWGQKGNFLDVPTDCPQRDERLGWTGDAQAFSRTAAFNMNVNNFFSKWLRDVEADQVNGLVPHVIPNVLNNDGNSAGWADAATIVPWNMYLAYGDMRILKTQYGSMKAFVESVRRTTKDDLCITGFHFGDWLFYRPFDDNDGRSAITDKYLIAQCFYANATQLLINTARLLGEKEDEKNYTILLQKIKAAFNREFVTATGRLVSGSQTAYVLALQFNMLPEELRKQAAERLVQNINSYGHLTTGFLGTPYLCHVLTQFGYTDVAYKLLLREDYPSWLYPVKMGATTIWERWDGMRPDSSFQTPGMNSFNHYAYGAIGDWMYRVMAGVDTYEDGVGYKHIIIKPHPGKSISTASASLKTYYGVVSNSWVLNEGVIKMTTTIPVNTKANIFIPAADIKKIKEGGKALSLIKNITVKGINNGYAEMEVGSGNYSFESVCP